MDKICLNFTKNLLKILEMFDNLMKFWCNKTKSLEKYRENITNIKKQNWSVLNICWNFEISNFEKVLCKFWECSRFLKKFG